MILFPLYKPPLYHVNNLLLTIGSTVVANADNCLATNPPPNMHLLNLCLTALLAIQVSASPVVEKRSITCLKVGATATAVWTNAAGKSCRWTGIVGSNFGTNSANGGEYAAYPIRYPSIQYLICYIVTAVTAAAEQVAQALHLETHTHRIASRTIYVRGSTMLVVVRG